MSTENRTLPPIDHITNGFNQPIAQPPQQPRFRPWAISCAPALGSRSGPPLASVGSAGPTTPIPIPTKRDRDEFPRPNASPPLMNKLSGYISPPASRRTSDETDPIDPRPSRVGPLYDQRAANEPFGAQAPPVPFEVDLMNRLTEIQETASHLYYFTATAKHVVDTPPQLDNLNTLLSRVRFAGDFLQYWYHRIYEEQQMKLQQQQQQAALAHALQHQQQQQQHFCVDQVENGSASRHQRRLSSESDGSQTRLTTKKRVRSSPRESIRCHQCGIAETPEWRRGPDGARTLCNACGLYHAKLVKKKGEAEAAEILRERRESRLPHTDVTSQMGGIKMRTSDVSIVTAMSATDGN